MRFAKIPDNIKDLNGLGVFLAQHKMYHDAIAASGLRSR